MMLGDVLNKYPTNNVYTLDVRELLQGGGGVKVTILHNT